MKKLILIMMVSSLFFGCMFTPTFLRQDFIYKDLSIAGHIRPNMTTEEVLNIMGEPVVSDLDRGVEEWHYCHTGKNSGDTFVAIYFVNNLVVAKKHYLTNEGFGSCERFVKQGNYEIPPEVQAILDNNTLNPSK